LQARRRVVQLRLQSGIRPRLSPSAASPPRERPADNQRRAHDVANLQDSETDFVRPNLPRNRPPSSHAHLPESVFTERARRAGGWGRPRWRILKVRARRAIPLYRHVTQQSQHALSRSFEKSWTHTHAPAHTCARIHGHGAESGEGRGEAGWKKYAYHVPARRGYSGKIKSARTSVPNRTRPAVQARERASRA